MPLQQERWEQLADHAISPAGEKALAIRLQQWRHGETENFIVHYRSLSDALQIAREIEFDLWYVAQSLGAKPEQYARKSHVYVFQNEKEWQLFLSETQAPAWAHSFANGDDLFLDVRAAQGGFDSQTLAHETTHDLPVVLPADFPRENILAALPRDKKFENGRVRFVVAHEIGRASVADNVTMEDLRGTVAEL